MALEASDMTYTRVVAAFVAAVGEECWKALPRAEQLTAVSLVQGAARRAAEQKLDELAMVILEPAQATDAAATKLRGSS